MATIRRTVLTNRFLHPNPRSNPSAVWWAKKPEKCRTMISWRVHHILTFKTSHWLLNISILGRFEKLPCFFLFEKPAKAAFSKTKVDYLDIFVLEKVTFLAFSSPFFADWLGAIKKLVATLIWHCFSGKWQFTCCFGYWPHCSWMQVRNSCRSKSARCFRKTKHYRMHLRPPLPLSHWPLTVSTRRIFWIVIKSILRFCTDTKNVLSLQGKCFIKFMIISV